MKDEKKMSFFNAVKLQFRAMKDIRILDPQYLPSIALEKIVSAAAPFVLIYFSARILNELAGARRADVLWTLVALTVAAGGIMALLKAVLMRWRTAHEKSSWIKYRALLADKLFRMDFADADRQSTHDMRSQIEQNEQWRGLGLARVPEVFSGMIEALAGIAGATALTVSLFSAKVPDSSTKLRFLNSPLFAVALLGMMVILCALSGRLDGYVESLETALVGAARLGNRIFGYFGFFQTNKKDIDVRMYDQYSIASYYFRNSQDQGFGARGPFARLARGRGGICTGIAASLSAVFTGSIYVFTCLKALAGAFGVGSVTQYVGAATAFSRNLTTLFSSLEEIRNNGRFLELCYEFLDIPNSMYQGSLTTEKRNDRRYSVEFRDVSFKYPGTDTWALRHVSMSFRIGRRMAVVGENGSGKTTFIKLLCRLYDPQEGEILLNGIDIKKYDYREYMDLFAVVFQDFQLLSQPLADNVAGSSEYDPQRVLAALKDAGFGERLKSMPRGINTWLYRQYDDSGVELSGGEAQKIAIARALYRDAPFLILDEPTAALDPIAEAEIYAQLNQIVSDRTAVYISHRLSSCRFCDEILVFDHGRIVQSGSHEELVRQKGGRYYSLWHAQAQYYAADTRQAETPVMPVTEKRPIESFA